MITAAVGQPVLELTGIGKDFGAIRALHGIDMQVSPARWSVSWATTALGNRRS